MKSFSLLPSVKKARRSREHFSATMSEIVTSQEPRFQHGLRTAILTPKHSGKITARMHTKRLEYRDGEIVVNVVIKDCYGIPCHRAVKMNSSWFRKPWLGSMLVFWWSLVYGLECLYLVRWILCMRNRLMSKSDAQQELCFDTSGGRMGVVLQMRMHGRRRLESQLLWETEPGEG